MFQAPSAGFRIGDLFAVYFPHRGHRATQNLMREERKKKAEGKIGEVERDSNEAIPKQKQIKPRWLYKI